jgi:hypothetical protein
MFDGVEVGPLGDADVERGRRSGGVGRERCPPGCEEGGE